MANTENTKAFYGAAIPSDWEVVPLEKVVLKPIVYGIVQAGPEIENGVHYIKSTDVGGEIIVNKLSKTSKEIAAKYNRSEVFPGDIVFSLRGNIGELSIVPEELSVANLTQGTARISVDISRFSSNFIKYVLHSTTVFKNIIQVSKGSTFSEISLGELRNIELPLPPLPEQRAIAQVLSLMDRAINTNNQLIAQKELRKKWLMQELLTGKKRLPAFAKATAGKSVVESGWKEYHLGEMFTERNETKYFDLPLLSVGQNGIYPQSDSIKKDTSNEDKSKYKRICPGDIGYNTMRMWQGRSALSDLEGIVSPAYTIVTPKKNADSLFFSYLFQMPKLTNLFWRNSQGLVDDTLNCKFKDFSIVRVFLPTTKEEQTAIAQVLQTADKEIQLLKAKTERLKEQKKGMMQVLLTGKKRLKIEPQT
ncbi:MAG: restriction endonuclease subunit S [Saprospiraceae bacterium]|nr:restriction endonuclease subunit S [Saprospiraceae bacterium]